MQVELKCAGIPYLGLIAVHCWFVVNDSGKLERWEVWQKPNVGGSSYGHVHRDLMRPDSNVGGSPTRLVHCWTGAQAEQIVVSLRNSCTEYPFRDNYCAVPGPNSNTYVAWILRQAGVKHQLSRKAIGKNFALLR